MRRAPRDRQGTPEIRGRPLPYFAYLFVGARQEQEVPQGPQGPQAIPATPETLGHRVVAEETEELQIVWWAEMERMVRKYTLVFALLLDLFLPRLLMAVAAAVVVVALGRRFLLDNVVLMLRGGHKLVQETPAQGGNKAAATAVSGRRLLTHRIGVAGARGRTVLILRQVAAAVAAMPVVYREEVAVVAVVAVAVLRETQEIRAIPVPQGTPLLQIASLFQRAVSQ